jgi:hypothetical protein
MAQRPFDITRPVGTDPSVEQAHEGHEITDGLSDMSVSLDEQRDEAACQMQSDIEILAELNAPTDEGADGDECESDDL